MERCVKCGKIRKYIGSSIKIRFVQGLCGACQHEELAALYEKKGDHHMAKIHKRWHELLNAGVLQPWDTAIRIEKEGYD